MAVAQPPLPQLTQAMMLSLMNARQMPSLSDDDSSSPLNMIGTAASMLSDTAQQVGSKPVLTGGPPASQYEMPEIPDFQTNESSPRMPQADVSPAQSSEFTPPQDRGQARASTTIGPLRSPQTGQPMPSAARLEASHFSYTNLW